MTGNLDAAEPRHRDLPYTPGQRPPGPPFSRLALSGFVCSLLGWTGMGAILGVIFGIAGILATAGGRLRGRGLAIAALPISLVTGAVFLVLLVIVALVFEAQKEVVTIRALLAHDEPLSAEQLEPFRALCSVEFNAAVSDAALRDWLQKVRAAHGKLMQLAVERASPPRNGVLVLPAKFVNGPADVTIAFEVVSLWSLKVEDLQVGGDSPRVPR